MVKNFRYEDEGAIALSGYPENAAAVDWLYEQGIRAVVSLHPVPDAAQARIAERGIHWHPFLLNDYASGLPGSLEATLEFVRQHAETDPAVLIH